MTHPTVALAANCKPAGTWPGPRGRAYLNEFYTGVSNGTACTYYVADNTFIGNTTLTPNATNNVWMEANVTVAAGASMTLPSGATLLQPNEEINVGLIVNGSFVASPNSIILDQNTNETVNAGGTMDIQQGAILKMACCTFVIAGTVSFEQGSSLQMTTGGPCCPVTIDVSGTLNVNGTSTNMVTFGINTPTIGWYGLAFEPGSGGTVNYLHISNAGGTVCNGGVTAGQINICGSPTIENSVVDNGTTQGIYVASGSPTLTNDAINNNTREAIYYAFTPTSLNASGLQASGNYSGSPVQGNAIVIASGTYSATGTWSNPGIPVEPGGLTIASGASLTIGAGMTLAMGGNQYTNNFVVNGQLNLAGTSAQRVVVTNNYVQPSNGSWDGIQYKAGSSGTIAYATLEQVNTNFGCPGASAAVIQICGGNPQITNTVMSNCPCSGIDIAAGSSPTLTSDTFTQNTGYAVVFESVPTSLTKLKSLHATGNGDNAIYIPSGTYSGTGIWTNPGLPLVLYGNVTVPAGAKLTIAAANKLRSIAGNPYTTFLFDVSGTLNYQGTMKAPITVNSGGLMYEPGSLGAVTFTRFSSGFAGGGCTPANEAATIVICGSSPTINNTTIDTSRGFDVTVTGGGLPTLNYDSFGAVSASWGVLNDGWTAGQPLVDASHSYWGAANGPSGAGSGSGTPVSSGVNFTPWLGLTVTPSSGAQGSPITISGTGYREGETVTVKWNCLAVTCAGTTLGTPTADSSGAFTLSTNVPASPLGGHTIGAIGGTSRAFTSATYNVTS